MVFQRKASFFLDLSGDEGSGKAKPPVTLAVREEKAAPAAAKPAKASVAAAAAPAAAPTAASGTSQPVPTTAEAIAAELRAAQEARPAPSQATFAPDCLNPANAVPQRRRLAGANLAGFRAMGKSLFGR